MRRFCMFSLCLCGFWGHHSPDMHLRVIGDSNGPKVRWNTVCVCVCPGMNWPPCQCCAASLWVRSGTESSSPVDRWTAVNLIITNVIFQSRQPLLLLSISTTDLQAPVTLLFVFLALLWAIITPLCTPWICSTERPGSLDICLSDSH